MIIVDAHCDTITKLMETRENLLNNTCHLDLLRLKPYGSYVQVFAAFVEDECGNDSLKRALDIFDNFFYQIDSNSEHIVFCKSLNDINQAIHDGKIAALLSLENGNALQGELYVLRAFYRLGVRSICLTWNGKNEIADGIKSVSDDGLTIFGRSLIREMNSLGIIIDISHISVKSFWDVLEETKKPVIASHSNAKSICCNIRNLDDEQIGAMKKIGGVIGINLYPYFLSDTNQAGLCDVIKHIEHIASIGGIDCIGLGSDFDGIACTPYDIRGVEELYKIFDELSRLNYSESEIEKIAGQNFLRIFKEILE